MSVSSLEELFVDELKDIYNAEKQITKALPKLAKAATSEELRNALQSHLQETEGQIDRLEQIFEILGESPRGKTCHGMQGVLEEGAEVIEDVEKSPVRDAGLISAAQRVEHYEMAAYGSAREFARLLGQDEIVSLLEATLEEETAADQKLTTIAQSVNAQAQSDGGEEDEDEDEDEDYDDDDLEDEEEEDEEAETVPARGKAKVATKAAGSKAKSAPKTRSRSR